MEIRKMTNSFNKVEIPFEINLISYKGKEKNVEKTRVLNVLILNQIVNLGMIKLRGRNKTDNSLELELGTIHSGKYMINLTLDEFAMLFNIRKEIEENDQENQLVM